MAGEFEQMMSTVNNVMPSTKPKIADELEQWLINEIEKIRRECDMRTQPLAQRLAELRNMRPLIVRNVDRTEEWPIRAIEAGAETTTNVNYIQMIGRGERRMLPFDDIQAALAAQPKFKPGQTVKIRGYLPCKVVTALKNKRGQILVKFNGNAGSMWIDENRVTAA